METRLREGLYKIARVFEKSYNQQIDPNAIEKSIHTSTKSTEKEAHEDSAQVDNFWSPQTRVQGTDAVSLCLENDEPQ